MDDSEPSRRVDKLARYGSRGLSAITPVLDYDGKCDARRAASLKRRETREPGMRRPTLDLRRASLSGCAYL
jgi:hypothetical protein